MSLDETTSFTIGYERHTVESFLRTLVDREVDRVVDVRALPLSRRKGFSKTKLRDALAGVNIDYVHVRAAGNPYRQAKADVEKCLALYRSHLDTTPDALDEVRDAIVGRRAALLCVEADCAGCHRSVIVERLLRRAPGWQVTNL